mmetsp:Transcript_16063/g.52313  ORF Transcript_16063/g.52313 Transcript_16063/m.52313 type:complete len:205 (+) Transcript_16063:427-1041(+)
MRPASSESRLPERSSERRPDWSVASTAQAAWAELKSSALHDKLSDTSVWLSRAPSSSIRPPSSPNRLSRRLRCCSEQLPRRPRPTYRPPSACTALSARLSDMSTEGPSSNRAMALTPRSAILLCDKSRAVTVEFSARPVARMRTAGSSSRLPGRESIVSVSVTRHALAREVTSLSFIPNLTFSYSMPICLTPYVSCRLESSGRC